MMNFLQARIIIHDDSLFLNSQTIDYSNYFYGKDGR